MSEKRIRITIETFEIQPDERAYNIESKKEMLLESTGPITPRTLQVLQHQVSGCFHALNGEVEDRVLDPMYIKAFDGNG